jgi:glycosyltransferase involved in cell wall biosynthesis
MKKLHILIVYNNRLPVSKYGGTQRVIWSLGKELAGIGYQVTFLAGEGTRCNFAGVKVLDGSIPLAGQIPEEVDLVHSFINIWEELPKPLMVTIEGNSRPDRDFHINTCFVSRNHASRYGSEVFVYNGMDLAELGKPDLDLERNYLHFLGKAAWNVKNVKGCISIAREAGIPLRVLGGTRINLKMGLRITLDRNVRFEGMVGGEHKHRLINGSKALLFPVLWHEPFGIALTESLYFGCPVFGTPYGSLPELIPADVGFLSTRASELISALEHVDSYDRRKCHEYASEHFSSRKMAQDYLVLYEKILRGEALNRRPPRLVDTSQPALLHYSP